MFWHKHGRVLILYNFLDLFVFVKKIKTSIEEEQPKGCSTTTTHSFVLRRHPSVGPQIALERNFHKAYRPNHLVNIIDQQNLLLHSYCKLLERPNLISSA